MKTKDLIAGGGDVAIIGISGRFPGAGNIEALWDIIKDGKETISYYTRDELLKRGVDPALLDDPAYVMADGVVESADCFDSSFFGYTPREADFMDPQQRVFIEECWSALENAGYDPDRFEGEIGLFAGCSSNRYWTKNLSQHHDVLNMMGELQTIINNDKDFLTTRVSYKLNLKGPSVNIQTACSTSLVAVHFACQSLLTGQCDMALSGGVHIKAPRREGYIFEEGSIDSATGHCRPFDSEADGTIFGEGVGVVVLKRLEDAIRDRDSIVAVIKATSINNDGSLKVGYMAPGVTGQSKVISKALDLSGIDPGTITYIETHGTGTKMGDPIEIEALRRVYMTRTDKKNYCALGSIKANIGHLDAAAGVTGLIKAALVLKKRKLPPLTNFKEPNPELDLENSPFYINRELKDWESGEFPLRSAVSSFGIGGTNSHAILEEFRQEPSLQSSKRFHLLPLSAKNEAALQRMHDDLISHLGKGSDNVADMAYTLQNGRKEFRNRGMVIWDNSEGNDNVFGEIPYFKGTQKLSDPSVVFMFTGQGSQYINMARDLYRHFESIRTILDYADSLLREGHNFSLLDTIFRDDELSREKINETSVAQPALFVVQYAVVHLLMEFGVIPHALTGHSIGEITAACLSGVFSFEDALNLVAWRGRLMQAQEPGSMLSINLPEDQVKPLLNDDVELALVNAPNFCVISGSFDAIDRFAKKLSDTYPESRSTRLKTSHAFHSRFMEPAIEPFLDVLNSVEFGEVTIPFISNVTGTWIKNEEACDPVYWAAHIRSTVNFSGGISELMKDDNRIYIEVGPGNTLSMLLSQFSSGTPLITFQTVRHPKQISDDAGFFLRSVAGYWIAGGKINWELIYSGEDRYRVPLPGYSFERRKHWIDPKIPYNYHAVSGEAKGPAGIVPEYKGEIEDAEKKGSELLHSRPLLDNEFIAPATQPEKRIAEVWQELLGIKGIGVTDNFFFLGGHSLLASQIINRINEEFGAGLTLEIFFNAPTIRGLIENSSFRQEVREQVAGTKLDYSKALPLSPAQERLWIVNQIENNNPAYNISFSYIFEGSLNKEIFIKSLKELFDRHKILKSCVRTIEGKPSVFLGAGKGIKIIEKDFSSVPGPDKDNKIQDFMRAESRKRFSPEDCNLYRITLINLGADRILFNFTVHHIIFDGWSWGVFTRELREIYNSLLAGESVRLEPLPVDYFEYAISLREEDPEKKYRKSSEYWKKKLEGITGQLNFPLDFKRKEILTGEGARVALDTGAARTEKLKELARKENVTLYMLFLSAFGYLLSRYSGDKDICIGSPVANRPMSKLEKLIGLFINSVVMRLQVDEEKSFPEYLREVKKVTLEALSNQDLPFENLVDILQPERILNVNPVFQVMFAWQNAPRPPLDLDGIRSSRVFQKNGVSPLDMTFYAWEEDGNIVGEIEFCTDIFRRSTIESLKDNFLALLDNIAENPSACLKDISVISVGEKERLAQFNNTEVVVPDLPLQALFEKRVKKYSDKTAVEALSTGRNLTYSDLEDRSNRLAGYLFEKGFRPGDFAGISMDRTESIIIAVLAVLKAGGAYLPLDPGFPDERLFYMLGDSGARILITEEIYADRFRDYKGIKISYDSELNKISRQNAVRPETVFDNQSLAYIIYTSGSTGKPKGVKVHHQAVVNFINSMSKTPGIVSADRLLAVTTLSFDISILEIFLPLSAGATVILADTEHIADGNVLADVIEKYNISVMQATPVTWTILLGSGWRGNKHLKALCGGEALQSGLAKELIGKVKSLWNMYGPTETTVWSSCDLVTDHERILVGKPVNNTQFHILSGTQEQPVGSPGEVCIGGMGVSKGYHNREELTHSKFFLWNGSTIYRTGDIGRFLDNGKIELFGRTDNQIKLRGFRIELGEIEYELNMLEGVTEAVVKLEKFSAADERLIGYLCVNNSFNLTREQIVRAIEKNLPAYMIPSAFQTMQEFPRTLNGKIDRKALIFNPANMPEEVSPADEELTGIELTLLNIWRDILRQKNIGKNHNFFDVGGNSLLALSCINKIKEVLGSGLTFRDMIMNPTVRQLAEKIETQLRTPGESVNMVHLTDTSRLPLSINQKRLWLISEMQPDIASYIIPFTWKLTGHLDQKIFARSLDILFQRHHIMFSVIKESDGEPYCQIKPADLVIESPDLSGLSEDEKTEKINEIINTDSRKAFDLKNGPLFRLYLIRAGSMVNYFHMSVHHIIFDGWSWSVFAEDLAKIYNGLLEGKNVNMEDIEFQQYDYAFWEKVNANYENNSELNRFWEENLRGSSPVLNFPYDFQRTSRQERKGSFERIFLSPELTRRLRDITKKEGSSLFTTLLSVFGIQMQKYSGEDDLNIGLPVTYRPHSKLEKIFGMFVNTVVVRLRYENDLTFRDILRLTNEAALNAIAHQELPFENIVDIVKPERIANANPLFQVCFVWQNNLSQPMELVNIQSERISEKERTLLFDITMYLWENGDIVEGEIEYNTDLLKEETIVRLKNNFIYLLETVTGNPEFLLADIPVISDYDKLLLAGFNNTWISVPECPVQGYFEEQSGHQPSKPAVISGDTVYTYSELNERSNQLAHHLLALGVVPGDTIGICTERSAEMILSLFGILKAGCSYLPLDPSFPDDRLSYMMTDSGARLLISQNSLRDRFIKFNNLPVFLIDSDSGLLDRYNRFKPDIKINSSSPAYTIYTSGSTGRPKGVRVHHGSVVNLIEYMSKVPGISRDDSVLAVVTLSFDMSVFEIFVSLSVGATLVVAGSKDVADGTAIMKLIDKHNISVIQATPSFWNILLSAGWKGRNDLKALSGGEPLTSNMIREMLPRVKELWNCYGPTETTVYSTCTRITDPEAPVVIGRPVGNTVIHILDRNNKPLPVGVTGEVAIGGLGVTKGYVNKPELTLEKFITIDDGSTVYRTGDLGRFLPDGNIELFGRIDNQIKLRGFRIEPGEIESLLSGLPGVREAVIKLQQFDENDDRLVAFLNAGADFSMTREELSGYLTAHLPSYMVPSFFQILEEFPRLPNGKINKKALQLILEESDRDTGFDFETLTPTQKKLSDIWESILKVRNIRPDEDFFDIGGQSLLAIRCINKIREELGVSLTFPDLVENPTIGRLSEIIDARKNIKGDSVDLVHIDRTTDLPLTRNQKRLWIITRLNPGIPSYIIPYTYKLSGRLDSELFCRSLEILFKRHHIIFSVIKEKNGEPYAQITPTELKITREDWSGLTDVEKERKINDLVNFDSRIAYDLRTGPLYRMYLIRTSDREHYFHISIHHIVFDGWSWPVFVNDLSVIYNSLLNGETIKLEPVEFQQYDFAYWEEKHPGSDTDRELTEFWKEYLKEAPTMINFPYDFPRKEKMSGRGSYVPVRLDRNMAEKLRKLSSEENSSIFTTMLSTFGLLMQKYTGEDDINIGLPVVFRPHSKLENIFGMFVNTVVVRLRYEKELTFRKLVRMSNEAALSAVAHQKLPFENIVEIVNPERNTGANPIFQVSFVWQNDINVPMKLEGVSGIRIPEEERTTPFDLSLYLWDNGELVEGEIEYNTDLLKHETAVKISRNYLNLVEKLLDDPDKPVSSVSMITDEEKNMIARFNDTFVPYPKEKTIAQLFEEQAELYPDKQAVVHKKESLSYMQLDQKANRLARTLRKSGVIRNTPVGILADKSIDTIVAMLAILKAGGAYVPFDPEYPEQRKDFIAEDSGCRVILVQGKYFGLHLNGAEKINLDDPASYDHDSSRPGNINLSSDLAYIMYTSGTTGKPKGSMIRQYGVVRLVKNTNYLDITANDRILWSGAVVFDVTTFEIWGALLNGGTSYVVDKETVLDPKALGNELSERRITILWLTSALLTQISEARTDIFRNLNYLLAGGDVLSVPHINKVRRDNPGLKIINGYGPTENTTFSTTYLIERDFENNIPIGKPISNSTTYIFDRYMNYQPIGVIGELYVGGDGVSAGYLNRDDLNEKSFIAHPEIPGERLYKTGDYARWLPDGNIEFHGRIDNQLKVRGFRVELGEIEAVISEIDGVVETVIKPLRTAEGDYKLIAFLNVPENFSMEPAEIGKYIRTKLPPYMVPSAFKFMNGFPRNINGKIDRKALVYDVAELEKKEEGGKTPLTDIEKVIYDIWCAALKTKNISVTDNFFDIGGNSLMAISVFSKIETAFNIDLGLRLFFDSPRIKDLADILEVKLNISEEPRHVSQNGNGRSRTVKGEI